MNNSILHQQMFISDLMAKINAVRFDLADDDNYTKESAIADLSTVVEMLDQAYPRV